MGLRREDQFGIELEGTEGTLETLDADSFAGEFRDLDFTYGDEEYQRDNNRGTMTRRTSLMSKHSLRITGSCECIGGAVGTAAPWHKILQACGFAVSTANVNRFAYTSLTGTAPKIGDIVGNNASQGSATKIGIVIHIDTTAGRVWLHATTGTFANSDAITNYSRTNAFTLNSVATPAGYHFNPKSERAGVVTPSASVELRSMGQAHTAVGSRGNLTMSWSHGKPLLLQFEFAGVPVTEDDAGTPIEPGSDITPTVVGGVPQVVQSLPMELIVGSTTYTPVATQWELMLNNTLAQRATATNVDLHLTGHLPTRITDRNPQVTVDPEHVLPGDGVDFIGLVRQRTSIRMSARCGSPSHANGSIIMLVPTACMGPGQSRGDRDGIVTRNIRLDAVGNDDDEVRFYHIFNP